MNIDQFIVMDTVVRLGSFSAAAKALNKVQSAVSYTIKSLEEELGVELFSRAGYRPQLTDAGEAVLRKARGLLLEVEEIALLGRQLTQGTEPLLRFDITPTCPMTLITPVLSRIAEEFPHTQLVISMEVFGGETLVSDDEVDLSLTDLVAQDDRLEAIFWRDVPFVAVAAPSHPLARQPGEPISPANLAKHVQIVVRSTAKQMQNKHLGVHQGNLAWRVSDFATKHQLIRAGLGWGHLPRDLVEEDLSRGQLSTLTLSDFPSQVAKLHLVRKRRKPHGPVAERLWSLLLEAGGVGDEKGRSP